MSLSPGEELITLTGHKRNVSSIAFSTDNLASASSEGTVNIWSTNDWSELRTIKLHAKGVFPLTFSPDCKTLAVGTEYRVRTYSIDNNSLLQEFPVKVKGVYHLAYSPNNR